MDGLTEGRIVHYVLENGTRYAGEHRPAIIVKVWSKNYPGTSNLCVFVDGSNDFPFASEDDKKMAVWRTSVNYSETHEPGTWHWIEKA